MAIRLKKDLGVYFRETNSGSLSGVFSGAPGIGGLIRFRPASINGSAGSNSNWLFGLIGNTTGFHNVGFLVRPEGNVLVGGRSQGADSFQQLITTAKAHVGEWNVLGFYLDYANDQIHTWLNGDYECLNVTFGSSTYVHAANIYYAYIGHSSSNNAPVATEVQFDGHIQDFVLFRGDRVDVGAILRNPAQMRRYEAGFGVFSMSVGNASQLVNYPAFPFTPQLHFYNYPRHTSADIPWTTLGTIEQDRHWSRSGGFRAKPRYQHLRLASIPAAGGADATLSAPGTSALSFIARALTQAAVSSAGAATPTFAGKAVALSSMSSAGAASPSLLGRALFSASLSAAGVAAASYSGRAVSVSALGSAGTSAASYSGKALSVSLLSSSGAGAASWAALTTGFADATMLSSGAAAATYVGRTIAKSALSSTGAGVASWVALVTGFADAAFLMPGATTPSLVGRAVAKAAVSSAGVAAAAYSGQTLRQGALSSAGASTTAFAGRLLASGVLSAQGSATPAWVAKILIQSAWSSTAPSAVNWLSSDVDPAILQLLRATSVFTRLNTPNQFVRLDTPGVFTRT